MLENALFYADLGLSVIPIFGIIDNHCDCDDGIDCSNPGKHPRVKWKISSKKCLSKSQLEALWEKHPISNVGIVTGDISGIAVLDVDGDEGVESLRKIGIKLKDLPETPTSKTGGGGYHFIFKMSSIAKTKAGVLKNVDIRANGGMIVAPPSIHKSGNIYTWIAGRALGDVDIAEFDFSILESSANENKKKKKKKKKNLSWFEDCLSGVGKGLRNDSATRLAGRYFSFGMSKLEVRFILKSWNEANNPSLPASEIDTVIESIETMEQDKIGSHNSDMISIALGIHLDSVSRISGDEPQYVLNFDEGKCTMTVAQMLSPLLFRQSVAEGTNVLIRKLSSKTTPTHDMMAHSVMNCAEDIDAGIEATNRGEIIALLKDFIRGQKIIPDMDQGDEIPHHGSFQFEEKLWISIEDLVHRGGQKWGMKIPMKMMAQRLRAIGMDKKSFKFSDGSNKTMWNIDPDNLKEEPGDELDE